MIPYSAVVVLRDGGICDFGPANDCAAAMAWYRVGDGKELAGVPMDPVGPPYWRAR
jgi:hypothetical protein